MKEFGEHYLRGLGMSARNNALGGLLGTWSYLSVSGLEVAVARTLHLSVAEGDPEER
jgi:hypothetical protein